MTIAFIFPGQGSQSIGMLASFLAENDSDAGIIKETFAIASDVLGFDLWKMISEGPVDELNKTENTQPALLAVSVALWKIWQAKDGVTPQIMAGHSLGEYSALVCANVLDFAQAIELVAARGRFMQQAVSAGEGAMAAVLGVEDSIVIEICEQISRDNNTVVAAVNFNSPGQVVIAGYVTAVEKAIEKLKASGAKKCIKLPVSVPSHSALMKPSAEQLAEKIKSIQFAQATINVINNVDVAVEKNTLQIEAALVKQLTQPVRWVETIEKMKQQGVTHIIECGPGKVLTGLGKRIDKTITGMSIEDLGSMEKALDICKH